MAAGALLVAYVLLLLALTYFEQQARVDADAEQVRLGLEKRASALSYFFSVRRDDLRALVENRSITTFFSNRDLGMSMEYGLGASLVKVRQAFDRLVDQRRIAGEPVYLRILLREPDGNILIDTKPRKDLGLGEDLVLDPDASSILAQGSPSPTRVLVAVPLNYKGRLAGHLLAWVNLDLAQHHLIAADRDQSGGRLLLHVADTPLPEGAFVPDTAETNGVWPLPSGGFAARVTVADTPFELLGSFPPSGLSRFLSPRWVTTSLLILAILILAGVWVALRMRTDNLMLRVRFEESGRQQKVLNRKNQELELEIVQRRESERELLQAREEAEAASQSKSEFLATMSHEIRTPLNGVLGMTQVLEATELDPEQVQYVEVINDSGRALLGVINDILDFSKIEAGRMTLDPMVFDLKACAKDVMHLFAGKASEKGLFLRLDYVPDCPQRFVGDAGRVRQILLNLVGNAIKFSECGHVGIAIRRTSGNAERAGLRIEVNDTGIGIPGDRQGKLFQAFTQVDGATTRQFGGTGLGLVICKKLVELMGGDIDFHSVPDKGSQFWFDLELPIAAEPRPQPPQASAQSAREEKTKDRFSGHILLAEDVLPNRLVAGAILKKCGLEVDYARDGIDAVEKWKNGRYDLILMDCHMPEMDGYQATRAIRESETAGHIPVIALTADAFEDNRERCLEAGMDDFVSKPFETRQLCVAIEKWLPPAR
ncbi:MAG: ATP-binding protein [Pseudomonadota bacterium]|nr:ATP-binding protein [Pseudomonadota bacterium]